MIVPAGRRADGNGAIACLVRAHECQPGRHRPGRQCGGKAGGRSASARSRATADGYTLGIGQWSHYVLNGATYALQYDLLADFAPVRRHRPVADRERKDLPANDHT
jgi:hypothetical protein